MSFIGGTIAQRTTNALLVSAALLGLAMTAGSQGVSAVLAEGAVGPVVTVPVTPNGNQDWV
ncbi:hypothetical protein KNE206_11060 [Kitasatospora sp. NE20-6]|uniref:hypothetical protein n=1 Tax=Kitasatospora sp. NE20-6 TaxID=2859066 RepID=UPI0034DCB31A